MGKLDGKVAIITGSTSGIGEGSALLFAQEGAKVVVVGRNKERGDAVVSKILENGGEAFLVQADSTEISNAKYIVDAAVEKYSKIDILFNNAGVVELIPFEENTEDQYDRIMNIDLKFPFFLTQAAMPYLLETKGNCLFTASVAGHQPVYQTYLYNISKAAIIMLAKCLAAHYAEKGLRFNVISPGTIATPIIGPHPDGFLDTMTQAIPAKRMGTVEEVAKLALFLASDDAPYINGADVLIDGAFNVKY